MRMCGNSLARSLIQRIASRFSRNGSIRSKSGRCCRTTLFASSKVCAAPQTWYRGSRPIIATKPCSPIMVSPTATTRHGSLPERTGTRDFTAPSLTRISATPQAFKCVFYENNYRNGVFLESTPLQSVARSVRQQSCERFSISDRCFAGEIFAHVSGWFSVDHRHRTDHFDFFAEIILPVSVIRQEDDRLWEKMPVHFRQQRFRLRRVFLSGNHDLSR